MINKTEPAEAWIIRAPQRDTRPDAAELERALRPYLVGLPRDHAKSPDGGCFYGHVLCSWLRADWISVTTGWAEEPR